VQIFPLLAAGCEVGKGEDREWVEQRWSSMVRRMWIGNVDRCWEVMQEVWSRRDADAAIKSEVANAKRAGSGGMGMVHSEDSKRRFEEELAAESNGFSFEDMLNGNTGGGGERKTSRDQSQSHNHNQLLTSAHGGGTARNRMDPVTEEIDPELTVRGRMHWVGVMKDWEWESMFFSPFPRFLFR